MRWLPAIAGLLTLTASMSLASRASAKDPIGSACFSGFTCTSSFCVDNVCCDRACTGNCESCGYHESAGTIGKCFSAVRTPRTACLGGSTPCAGSCDGTSPECAYPTTECRSSTCASSIATSAAHCSGGACPASTVTLCSPWSCNDDSTACAATCDSDASCAADGYCGTKSGVDGCFKKEPLGTTCARNLMCASGNCVDGVCCSSACAGQCQACNGATKGTCEDVVGAPRGTRPSCGAGLTCIAGGVCGTPPVDAGVDTSSDAASDTTIDSPDTAVGDTAPVDASPLDTSTADGAGLDASAGDGGTVVAPVGVITCKTAVDCASGFCVDGVCCDAACTETCHSCALPSAPGKCTVEPVGVDLRGSCGIASSCVSTCGPGGTCIGSGKGTQCAPSTCTGATTGVGPSACSDAKGTCQTAAAIAFDCGAYVCEPAFGACLSRCTASNQCAPSFVCDIASGTCVPTDDVGEDSGCAVANVGESSRTGLAMLLGCLGAGLVARGRRRRARSSGADARHTQTRRRR